MKYIIKNKNEYKKEDINNFYNKLYYLKKEKINNYRNESAKISSIIGDMLLYELLSKYNLSYDNIDFIINKYGKPYIKNSNIYFNISHSYEYIITVISNKEIGIDIEKIRKTQFNVVNQFATENEKRYIFSKNKDIEKRIFEIYTLKEAYIKMKGTNLNNALDVEFNIINNKVLCSDKTVKCGFISIINDYIIAYCEKI